MLLYNLLFNSMYRKYLQAKHNFPLRIKRTQIKTFSFTDLEQFSTVRRKKTKGVTFISSGECTKCVFL